MSDQYKEGPEALKSFEEGMKKLFQAPKAVSPFKPPPAKPKEPARTSVCAYSVLAVA